MHQQTIEPVESAAAPVANAASGTKARFPVLVTRVAREAEGILSFEFRDLEGRDLPPFTAGAHLEIQISDGIIRSYSLCNDPAERHRYVVTVLKEESGRGGSRAMHEMIGTGARLLVSPPRNHFPLAGREARRHLLVAGGIGVTPMIAMIAELESRGARWSMHYCTRSPERTAFLDVLQPFVEAGKVFLHHDGGDPARGLDLKAALSEFGVGTHLYYCGPPGFMAACAMCLEPWPPHAVHREFFASPAGELDTAAREPFQVKLNSTGEILDVPVDRSIADVLRSTGSPVETDCEDGYCGTCITRYLAGTPEHRDTVLSEKERRSYLMVCCARAKGGVIELDL